MILAVVSMLACEGQARTGSLRSGELPPSVGRVASLTGLNLSGNQLMIPAELGGLIGLVELSLHFNQLTGRLAAEMGNLTDLAKLYPHSD